MKWHLYMYLQLELSITNKVSSAPDTGIIVNLKNLKINVL
jgi:hypothetical protein